MASKDKKASEPSRKNRTGYVRTLSDLNRFTADSDSDSDGPQEYYTGGEKSGMLVQDPSKDDPVQAIFDQAKLSEALEGPAPEPSSSRSFAGTHRLLLGESAQPAPQQPENVVHNISFWTNGFTIGEGPLRRFDDPENASFLESIKNSKCPEELEPADKRSSVYVTLTRRNENFPEPEKCHVPFQGVGRTLAGSSASVPSSSTTASAHNSFPVAKVVVDETMPQTSIQIRLADGSRLIGKFNHHHTISDLRSFIDGSRLEAPRNYLLQVMGFPLVILSDPAQTIEQAGLTNSVVIQKF